MPDHTSFVFHNLQDYDTQLFFKDLEKNFSMDDTEAIAENKEKDIGFYCEDQCQAVGVNQWRW